MGKSPFQKRYLVLAAKGGFSLGLLALAVWLLDQDALGESLSKVGLGPLALAVAVLHLEFPILGYRWHLLARDHNQLNLKDQLRTYFIAVFFNNFTPGQLGSDAYRFTHHRKAGSSERILAALLIRERLIGLAGFLLFFLICYCVENVSGNFPTGESAELIHGAALLIGVALLGLFALPLLNPVLAGFSKRLSGNLGKLLAEVAAETTKVGPPDRIAAIMVLTLLGAGAIWTGAVKIVAVDLGSEVSFFALGMIAVLANLLRLIPLTIQGVGVRENVFAFMFGVLGLPPEQGFVVGLVAYMGVSLATVAIGVIGTIIPREEREP